MSKLLATAFAAALVLVFATAAAGGAVRLEGTVAATFPENRLIRVDARRSAFVLRVPGSQSRIRVGQRVELRGTTLRRRGSGSLVLARGVTIAGSTATSPTQVSDDDNGRADDTDDTNDDSTDDDDGANRGPGNGDDDHDDHHDHGGHGHGGDDGN